MTTRTKTLHLILVATLLGACATTAPSPNLSVGSAYYIPSFQPHDVRRDVMSRYMCLNGRPMTCECSSTLAPTCRCVCMPFGPNWELLR
jgi:hypothetical protein